MALKNSVRRFHFMTIILVVAFLIIFSTIVDIIKRSRESFFIEPDYLDSELPTVVPPHKLSEYDSISSKSNSTKSNLLRIFVAIYSAPRHLDRRNAVRSTWMATCKALRNVVCWFITDGQDNEGKAIQDQVKNKLMNESRLFGDLLFAQSPGGINFARRYLWVINWATKHYKFQYLLRVDDDYFVCLERLLLELPFRPKTKLVWGWLHCWKPGAVAIDEGFIIVTQDVVMYLINRINSTLLCHPYGGQAMGMWLTGIPGLQIFGDNRRIIHDGFDVEDVWTRNEVCRSALAIHRSYPEEMRHYWQVQRKEITFSYVLPPVRYPCRLPPFIDYKVFGEPYYAVPKLCKDLPIWHKSKHYQGRKGKK